MLVPGKIVLFKFPFTDLSKPKLRPALLLSKLPGDYSDWLICMISSNLEQFIDNFDEIIFEKDSDFVTSGLKAESVFRIGRLAVMNHTLIEGSIGHISKTRLNKIKSKIAKWIKN